MLDQDGPGEKFDQHKSLEETMREALVSRFMETLKDSDQITSDQAERIKKLLSQGQVSSQVLLNILRVDSEADSNG